MSYYDDAMFGSTDSETTHDATADDDDTEPFRVRKWKLGGHSMKPTVNPDDLRADAVRNAEVDPELAAILEQAAERVQAANVGDFQCPVCGLSHGHGDAKHDIRQAFDVTTEFAEMMEFAPNCHCGVNELALLMDFFDYLRPQVFDDEDDMVAFTELMPSEETDMALQIVEHPEISVRETGTGYRQLPGGTQDTLRLVAQGDWTSSKGYPAVLAYQQVLDVARLPRSGEVTRALETFVRRKREIQSAADNAPIPTDTEQRLESIRDGLVERFLVDDDQATLTDGGEYAAADEE